MCEMKLLIHSQTIRTYNKLQETYFKEIILHHSSISVPRNVAGYDIVLEIPRTMQAKPWAIWPPVGR